MDAKSTPANIQNELNKLIKSFHGIEGTKACLFNLIVYTHEPRRTQYFKEMVKIVISQFPCRIIFIQGNPQATENLFRLQVFTEKSHSEHKIICDQIYIEASGQDLERVNFILLPLLVPDLPIYLLWGQNPALELTILPHLEDLATRLIFDSEASEDLQQFSRDMLSRNQLSSIPIKDMNWARIAGWKEVLAQVFDSAERLQQLATSDSIKIKYNNRPSKILLHPDTQAIYLQAWIASCLNWKFQKMEKIGNSQIVTYQGSKTKHQIELISELYQDFEPEEIIAITIEKQNEFTTRLERMSNDQIKVNASNQDQCSLPFTLLMPNLFSGRNFMQEIFFQKPSEHYMAILRLISLVKWSN